METSTSPEHGREIDAHAVVTDHTVEEVEASDEKAHTQESRPQSIASSHRTGHDEDSNDTQNVEASTTNSEQWSVFSTPQKRFIVLMVAFASFFSPLSG